MTEPKKEMDDVNLPNIIPIDEDFSRYHDYNDYDDDDSAESNFSITSSVYNFRVEHGRRYHDYREGHPFPFDEMSKENERVMHEMILRLFDNKWYLSPISEASLKCIADVGSGLGLWTEGVAERLPDAEVVGIDTTPHERTTAPNCTYIISDATDEWVLDNPNMKFDLVHIRNLFVGVKDWDVLYNNCFENMNSNGWIEQIEMEIEAYADDHSELPDSQVIELCRVTKDMTIASGRDFQFYNNMKSMIEEAGFVDVREQRFKLPLGGWSSDPKLKDLGFLCERFYKTGLQGWLLHICTRHLGWTVDQVNEACMKAFDEIDSRQQHLYFRIVMVLGRKP